MPLSFDSPRFARRGADLRSIDSALASTGHVVLDDVWNGDYLAGVRRDADGRFQRDDKRFANGFEGYPDSVVECYLGSFIGLENLFETDASLNREQDLKFFSEFELSGFPGLLRVLLNGDFFVGRSERVIRRADPRFAIRFIGLHPDGQLGDCSRRGFNTKRELTIWTPLQDCTADDTPRLLLMHKGETYTDLFDEGHPPAIERRRKQIRNEAEVADTVRSAVDRQFEQLFAERRCYAPYVPLGGSIIFEAGVFHASYVRHGMTVPRFSLDFRSVGDFKRTAVNRSYVGQTFKVVPIEVEPRITERIVSDASQTAKTIVKKIFPALTRLGH
jgi:hypothetical protein